MYAEQVCSHNSLLLQQAGPSAGSSKVQTKGAPKMARPCLKQMLSEVAQLEMNHLQITL